MNFQDAAYVENARREIPGNIQCEHIGVFDTMEGFVRQKIRAAMSARKIEPPEFAVWVEEMLDYDRVQRQLEQEYIDIHMEDGVHIFKLQSQETVQAD